MTRSFARITTLIAAAQLLSTPLLALQPPHPGVSARRAAPSGWRTIRFEPAETAEPRFVARTPDYNISLGRSILLRLKHGGTVSLVPTVTRSLSSPVPLGAPEGRVNYCLGRETARWRTGVPFYSGVRYSDVTPGVSLDVHDSGGRLEYDYRVRAHADSARLGMRFAGATRVALLPDGSLKVAAGSESMVWRVPNAWQDVDGVRRPVLARYARATTSDLPEVRFKLGTFDHSRPLVIDPVLAYCTLLGGGGSDWINGAAADSAGAVYVAGGTDSNDFPLKGAAQSHTGGNTDAFVAKFSASGQLVYATYLGGSNWDDGECIAVDATGAAYVGGQTQSQDFPVTKGALQIGKRARYHSGFVTKLGSSGQAVFSTYYGGSWDDWVQGIAVDAAGSAYITGYAGSFDLTTTNGSFQPQHSNIGYWNGFAAKLKPDGTGLVYGTYLHGSFESEGRAIAVDAHGNAYVGGATSSRDFPVAGGFQTAKGGAILEATTDGGLTWQQSDHGIPAANVSSITFDPQAPNNVYANSDSGIYASSDGGANWAYLNVNPFVQGLTVDPTNSLVLYVYYWGGVLKSTNRGATWTWIGPQMDCRGLAVDKTSSATVYVAGLSGVYKSTSAGSAWASSNSGLPRDSAGNYNIYSLAMDPKTPGTLYVGSQFGVYKSTNGAASWTAINTGVPAQRGHPGPVDEITISPSNTAVIYARSNLNVENQWSWMLRSLNGGRSWVRVDCPDVNGIAVDPAKPLTVYAARGADFGVTTNGGGTWKFTQQHESHATVAVNPSNGKQVLTGGWIQFDGFVAELNSAGTALLYSTFFGGSSSDYIYGLALDAAGNVLIAGDTNSEDLPVAVPLQPYIQGWGNGFVAKIGANRQLVYSTYLGGSEWDGARSIAVDPAGDAYIAGVANSWDFPVTNNALQANPIVTNNGFFTKLDPTGQKLLYSTLFTGADRTAAWAVAANAKGDIFIGGDTNSAQFPTVNAVQTGRKGTSDAFLARFVETPPVRLKSLSLAQASVPGGQTGTGIVTLTAAPAQDVLISLNCGNFSADVPQFVTVPAGKLSAAFPVWTYGVWTSETDPVYATYDSVQQASLTVRPVKVSKVAGLPSAVTTGQTVTFTVTLEANAQPGPISVTLTSSNQTILPVPVYVTVPYNATTVTFTATANSPGSTSKPVTITATAGGATVSTVVTVAP